MSFKEVNSLRKGGQLEEAIQMARADIETMRDEWSCKALFWCLNDQFKATEDIEEKKIIADEMSGLADDIGEDEFISRTMSYIKKAIDTDTKRGWDIYRELKADNSENIAARKLLLNEYLGLNVERPSLLHSLILSEAVRVEKTQPHLFLFSEFLNKWGLENLTDDDWTGFKTEDGKTTMPLVERMIYVYTREMECSPDLTPSEDFIAVLDKAQEKWASNVFISRCKAKILVKAGNKNDAVDYYKQLLVNAQDKFFLWSELAQYVEERDLKMGLLCKALTLNTPDEFLGKIRLSLAAELINAGEYGSALAEIGSVEELYVRQGWHTPPNCAKLRQFIPAGVKAEPNKDLYAEKTNVAEAFIYSSIPSQLLVKVGAKEEVQVKPDGKKRKIVTWMLKNGNGKLVHIRPKQFGLNLKIDDGSVFEVRMQGKRVVWIKPSDAIKSDWFKKVSGEIRIKNANGRLFGFVDNCYVHGKLLGGINDGETVTGVALRSEDGKWALVSLKRD